MTTLGWIWRLLRVSQSPPEQEGFNEITRDGKPLLTINFVYSSRQLTTTRAPICRHSRPTPPTFWHRHHRPQEPAVDINAAVAALARYPDSVKQMIATRLIFMYSHFNGAPDEIRLPSRQISTSITKILIAGARLPPVSDAETDRRVGRPIRIQLNPWQRHLLTHFELLEPFPQDVQTDREFFTFVLRPNWEKDLNFRENATIVRFDELGHYSREFGTSSMERGLFFTTFSKTRRP